MESILSRRNGTPITIDETTVNAGDSLVQVDEKTRTVSHGILVNDLDDLPPKQRASHLHDPLDKSSSDMSTTCSENSALNEENRKLQSRLVIMETEYKILEEWYRNLHSKYIESSKLCETLQEDVIDCDVVIKDFDTIITTQKAAVLIQMTEMTILKDQAKDFQKQIRDYKVEKHQWLQLASHIVRDYPELRMAFQRVGLINYPLPVDHRYNQSRRQTEQGPASVRQLKNTDNLNDAANIEPGGTLSHSRMVIISNLPSDIHLSRILERVRGGKVVSTILADSTAVTGGTKTALVSFSEVEAARTFFSYTQQHTFGFTRGDGVRHTAKITISSKPSHPLSGKFQLWLQHGRSRCLELANFPIRRLGELLTASGLTGRALRRIVRVQLVNDAVHLSFTGIEDASLVYQVVKSPQFCNDKALASTVPVFGKDPCEEDLSELALQDPYSQSISSFDVAPFLQRIEEFPTCRSITALELDQAKHGIKVEIAPQHPQDSPIYREIMAQHKKGWFEDQASKKWEDNHVSYNPESKVYKTHLPFGGVMMDTDNFWRDALHNHKNDPDLDFQKAFDLHFATTGELDIRKLDRLYPEQPIPGPANLWGALCSEMKQKCRVKTMKLAKET